MKEIVNQFWTYLKLLSKKWILWLFVALDAIGAFVTLILPQLNLPLPIYWGLALIGLLWAGFQVYGDIVAQLPPPAIEQAVTALDSPDSIERRAAIETLAQMSGSEARKALAEAVQHKTWDVRLNAAFALLKLGYARTVPGLGNVLQDALKDPDSQIRQAAAEGLGQIGDRDVIPYLVNLVTEERDWHLRRAAIRALGQIGDPAAVPHLTSALHSKVPEISIVAAEALKLIGTDEALAAIDLWQRRTVRPF